MLIGHIVSGILTAKVSDKPPLPLLKLLCLSCCVCVVQFVLIIQYFLYLWPPQVFQTFACRSLGEIDKSYLRADFRIECNTPEYEIYWIYAVIMVCVCE